MLDFGGFSWEERNQAKGYAQSEVRLVEIQEKLCDDVERGQDQCHDNHHAWEAHLEEWWQEHQDEKSLKDYLCVETLKVTRHFYSFLPKFVEGIYLLIPFLTLSLNKSYEMYTEQ